MATTFSDIAIARWSETSASLIKGCLDCEAKDLQIEGLRKLKRPHATPADLAGMARDVSGVQKIKDLEKWKILTTLTTSIVKFSL